MATCKIKLRESNVEDDSVSSCYLDVNLYTETKTIKAGAFQLEKGKKTNLILKTYLMPSSASDNNLTHFFIHTGHLC